jgi:hypothetical protein
MSESIHDPSPTRSVLLTAIHVLGPTSAAHGGRRETATEIAAALRTELQHAPSRHHHGSRRVRMEGWREDRDHVDDQLDRHVEVRLPRKLSARILYTARSPRGPLPRYPLFRLPSRARPPPQKLDLDRPSHGSTCTRAHTWSRTSGRKRRDVAGHQRGRCNPSRGVATQRIKAPAKRNPSRLATKADQS